jgi:predicted DNA-binding protein YlxM (UPF0122 family)|tara:strand:- start:23712 stop:24395 length:684 start_codon:yes stop_codon:yes gene_type:complete
MEGGPRITKRSCAFCQSDQRDELEEMLLSGDMTAKQMDKDMGWRANTADRHYRNHMGEYHMAANPSCKICSHPHRAEFESRYFQDGSESEAIASELEVSESTVYHHMKHHFQPLVQRTAAVEVALTVGRELDTLRGNVERLNEKLSELLSEGSVHEDGFVRDAVSLHKEVRESLKDMLKLNNDWGSDSNETTVNQTINVLKLEMSKESPETWSRIRAQLIEQAGGDL